MQLSTFLDDLHQVFGTHKGGDLVLDEALVRAFAEGLADAITVAELQEALITALVPKEATSKRIEALIRTSDGLVERIRADADAAEAGVAAMDDELGKVVPMRSRRPPLLVVGGPSGGDAA